MADLTNEAIFGYSGGSTLGANMVNPGAASDSFDWGAVLMNGIRGAAQGAIASQVNGAYASGQLVTPTQAQAQVQMNSQFITLLVIGGIIYALTKG